MNFQVGACGAFEFEGLGLWGSGLGFRRHGVFPIWFSGSLNVEY